MGKYNSINDAVRAKIDKLIEEKGLNKKDYLYTADVASSLNQLASIMGSSGDSMTIADSLYDVLDSVNGAGGGSSVSVPAKEVNFRDYDGTIVYSYTPAEFAALTAMPDNPDHSGDAIPLTAQGWNWSFERAQTYVAKYGRLEVGQMYATVDGKTHVLIHLERGRTSPILGCCPNGTVDVDWGDGTAHDTLTGTSVTTVQWTPMHEYAAPGDYDIKLTCTGTMGFCGSINANYYQNSELLRYSSSEDTRNFVYGGTIQTVYCADSVTSIGECAFNNCQSLSNVIIPDSVTSIGTYAFGECYSLSSITIPDSVTSLSDYALWSCQSLSNVIIPDSVTSIGVQAFSSCYSLPSITIPDSVTSIGDTAFDSCQSLPSITIPDGVTSIGTNTISNCYDLSNVIIPDSVTSIGSHMFTNCYGLGEIHFLSATPLTVSKYTFSDIPTDCKIYVPAGSLEAYTSAENYPSSSTYTYIEEA